jgi:hypothetical protein
LNEKLEKICKTNKIFLKILGLFRVGESRGSRGRVGGVGGE